MLDTYSYEQSRALGGHDENGAPERKAYEHDGVEPGSGQPADVELVRVTVRRIQSF